MCTYNGASTIRRAIESVLMQSYQNWELIVLVDGSTDETKNILLSFSDPRIFIYYNEKNLGIQKTRNKALDLCKGEFIAVLDDDDWWSDGQKIEKQVSFLSSQTQYSLIGTHTKVYDESSKFLYSITPPEEDVDIRKSFLRSNHFTHSSVMFRSSILEKVSGYSESLHVRNIEDYDFLLRVGLTGSMKNLRDVSTSYTLRSGSNSFKHKKSLLKNNISRVVRYRKKYPGFWTAYFFTVSTYVFYVCIYRFLPFCIKVFFLNLYKKI